MRRIKQLDPRLANQIAAGEVVERPASVLKELLENSLDAGAATLTIEVEKGGMRLMKVTDDGLGIHADDLLMSVDRHATSKVYDFDELQHIQSLGFRGEALASIASVSHLQLTSKAQGSEEAYQVIVGEDVTQPTIKPAAHPTGTTVEVRDLFFNVPARRKFLRTEKTEFSHIEQLVKRVALSHFKVRIKLLRDQRVVLDLPAATSEVLANKRVAKICGQSFVDNAWQVDVEAAGLRIHGWLGQPEFTRNQTDLQYTYVNGRMIRDKLITHAIKQCYESTLHPGHQPCYVLYLSIDPGEVDVNVHPTKHELRFREARLIHDFITHSLSQAFQCENAQENVQVSTADTLSVPKTMQHSTSSTTSTYVQPTSVSREAVSEAYQSFYAQNQTARESQISTSVQPVSSASSDSEVQVAKASLPPTYHVKTCLYQQYLLIERAGALGILDGYALQQYVAWLELSTQHATHAISTQSLLLPETIKLDEAVVRWVSELEKTLEAFGFIVQCMDVSTLVVRRAPKVCQRKQVATCVQAILSLFEGKRAPEPSEEQVSQTLKTIATAAIDQNLQAWSYEQYQTLLSQWLELGASDEFYRSLSKADLNKIF